MMKRLSEPNRSGGPTGKWQPDPDGKSAVCSGGDACKCNKFDIFKVGGMNDFHHYNETAEEKKKGTVDANGNVKNPANYSEDDWKDQDPWVIPICRWWHRQLTFNRKLRKMKFKQATSHIILRKYRNALAKGKSGDGCFATYDIMEIEATEDNMSAFDNHHLAQTYNLKFGAVTLVVRKYSELSDIVLGCTDIEDYIENMFPEVILTRLMDTRFHQLYHILDSNLDKVKDTLGVEFPFKLVTGHKGEQVLEYTGSRTDFDGMEEKVIELPSACGVLGLSNTAKRRIIE